MGSRERVFLGDPKEEVRLTRWEKFKNRIGFGWTDWTKKLQKALDRGFTKDASTYIRKGADVNKLELKNIEGKERSFAFVAAQANSPENRQLRNNILLSWKLCKEVKAEKNLNPMRFSVYATAAGFKDAKTSFLEDFKELEPEDAAERIKVIEKVCGKKNAPPSDEALLEAYNRSTEKTVQVAARVKKQFRGNQGQLVEKPVWKAKEFSTFLPRDREKLLDISKKIGRIHEKQTEFIKENGQIPKSTQKQALKTLKAWEKTLQTARNHVSKRKH